MNTSSLNGSVLLSSPTKKNAPEVELQSSVSFASIVVFVPVPSVLGLFVAASKIFDGDRLGKYEISSSVRVIESLKVGSTVLIVVVVEGVLVVCAFDVGKRKAGGVVNSYPSGVVEGDDRPFG